MKIFVTKYLNKQYNCSFKLNKIEGGLEILDLINNNVLILSTSNKLDLDDGENRPCICFIISQMIDDGDYDYDDNYVPNYIESYSYLEIFYSPITGEKIEFIIEKEIDNSINITNLENELDKLKTMRKSKKKDLLEKNIYEELNKYLSSNLTIIS